MGEVWRGDGPNGPVAVKLLRPDLAHDPDLVARFVQERRILVGLRSPHLVEVFDLVVEGDRLAIVMDLVDGRDLRSILREQGTLVPARAVAIAQQVLSGVAVAHAAGVVHRDLKPENILIESDAGDDLARVVDFGVARIAAGSAVSNATGIVGTPRYLAPEMAGRAAVTASADVYSVGIVLYEMLFGRPVFDGDTPLAVLRAHEEEAVGRPPDVPDRLWRVIERMLEKDPSRRPTALGAEKALAEIAKRFRDLPPFPPLPRADRDAPTTVGEITRSVSAATRRSPPAQVDSVPAVTPKPRRSRLRVLLIVGTFVVALGVGGWYGLIRGSASSPSGPGDRCLPGAPVKRISHTQPDHTILVLTNQVTGKAEHAGMYFGPTYIGMPNGEAAAMQKGGAAPTGDARLLTPAEYRSLHRSAPDGSVFREWAPREGEAAPRYFFAAGTAMFPVTEESLRQMGIDPTLAPHVPRRVLDTWPYTNAAPETLLRVAGSPKIYLVRGHVRVPVPTERLCGGAAVVTIPDVPHVLRPIPLAGR